MHADSAGCAKLYEQVKQSASTDNLIIGYKGAITASMADYMKSKEEKLRLFSEGKNLIEQSIKADASNVELRFLRFTIQTNAPKALGYNKQMEDDRIFINSHIGMVKDGSLQQKIKDYMAAHPSAKTTAPQKAPN